MLKVYLANSVFESDLRTLVRFTALATLDQRIWSLLQEVAAYHCEAEATNDFCKRDAFYHGLKPALVALVGYGRREGPAALQTCNAYDNVYHLVFDSLPLCRGKRCHGGYCPCGLTALPAAPDTSFGVDNKDRDEAPFKSEET